MSMPERSTGTVKWYNSEKGYGFITPDDGGEYLFFLRSSIIKTGFGGVFQDGSVDFMVERKDDGRMTAVNIDYPDDNFSPGIECFACGCGCGDIGHIASNCPDLLDDLPPVLCNEGWDCDGKHLSGGSGGCYECGYGGHFAKDCPAVTGKRDTLGRSSNVEDSGGVGCYRCGKHGHFVKDCPDLPPIDGKRLGGRSGGCYECGDNGHFARDCPAVTGRRDTLGRSSNVEDSGGDCCYRCGKHGHFVKDCFTSGRRDTLQGSNIPWTGKTFSAHFPPLGRSVKQMTETMEKMVLAEEEDARKPWEIKERGKEYKIRFDMPGMIRNDVKVWVENKMLVFKAEKVSKTKKAGGIKVEDEEELPAKSYGKYSKRIKFPEDVVFEEIKAEVRDGVLYLTVPKASAGCKILNINVL